MIGAGSASANRSNSTRSSMIDSTMRISIVAWVTAAISSAKFARFLPWIGGTMPGSSTDGGNCDCTAALSAQPRPPAREKLAQLNRWRNLPDSSAKASISISAARASCLSATRAEI